MDQPKLTNIEAEKAALGSILIDPEAIVFVMGKMAAADLFLERHKTIFRAMLRLHGDGAPIDLVSLMAILEPAEIGGESYLFELIDTVPTSAGAASYADIVAGLASRRRILAAMSNSAKSVYDLDLDTAEVESQVYQEVMASFSPGGRRQAAGMRQVVDNYLNVSEARANSQGITPTGLLALDNLLGGGLWPGELILVGARPGMGKTALAEMILYNCRRIKTAAAMFSLEMRSEALMDRHLARVLGRSIHEVRRHWELPPADSKKLYTELMKLQDDPFVFINDDAAITLPRLEADVTRLAMQQDIRVAVLDYIQLMDGGKQQNRHLEVSAIARGLKVLAQRLNIAIVAVAQLSRSVEMRSDKRPTLPDLKESGDLEQHADVVLFPFRPGYYSQDDKTLAEDAEINVAKQRNGAAGPGVVAHVRWIEKTASFANKT